MVPELPPAYYLPLGSDRYLATDATTSPWDPSAQHGGPPTALLGSCIDDVVGRADMRLARISMDFLGPVPKAELRVEVEGRPLNGLQRFLIVGDSANGLSAPLNLREWWFIPPGVTMHLQRYPVGDWIRLSARSDSGRDGIGLTEGTLSDRTGRCGTVTQPLLVAPR
jgi:hypothetical protein